MSILPAERRASRPSVRPLRPSVQIAAQAGTAFSQRSFKFFNRLSGGGKKIYATFAHKIVEKFETIATTEKNAKVRLFPFCLFFPKNFSIAGVCARFGLCAGQRILVKRQFNRRNFHTNTN
jgi:hypothetical protein